MRSNSILRAMYCIAILTVGVGVVSIGRAADPAPTAQTIQFEIKPQPLSAALTAFGLQSHQQILFTPEIANGKTSQGVKGVLTADAALARLLSGTGLSSSKSADGMVLVSQADAKGASAPSGPLGAPSGASNDQTQSSQPNKSVSIQTAASLEEVVVTAEKRTELLSKTPIAVSALNMSQLQDAGVDAVSGLTSTVPDLQIHTVGVDGFFGVTLRGISNLAYDPRANPAVSTYLDGVYVDLPQSLADEVYDLSRIEVLRGPQGTLYGRNSTGGNVNIITADPQPTFNAEADTSYGSYNDTLTHAMVNMPVTDTLAVRAALMSHRSDGYFSTEGTTARNYGAADDWAGRLTALWTPTDSFRWRVSFDDVYSHGTPPASIETGANQLPLNGLSPYHQPVIDDPEPDNYVQSQNLRSRMDWTAAENLTLTYVMGYQHLYQYFDWATTGQIGAPENTAYQQYTSLGASSQSHEVDATYLSDKLKNVLGGTYFYDTIDLNAYAVYPLALVDENLLTPEPTKKISWGVFDQATYSLLKDLRLTGGIRYSHDYQSQPETVFLYCFPPIPNLTVYQSQFLTPNSPGCAVSPTPAGSGTWSKVTWKGGLEYDLNPSTLTYASVTTGYKQGGVQPGLPAVFPATFQPETVTNYEVGAKTHLFGDSLNLRVAAFYEDYTNVQTFQLVTLQNVIGLATSNAGAARIYGTELESEWNPTQVDHLAGFLTYLHARYTNYTNAVDPRNESVIIPSLDGSELPNAPELSARLQYNHEFRLPGGGAISPQAAVYWQSTSYTQAINIDVYKVSAYSKTDLQLRYTDPSTRWNVSAYVTNLENHPVRTGDYSGSNTVFSDFAPPRLFGVRVSYQWQ
jgi:iron complex outermembrane receptor protein